MFLAASSAHQEGDRLWFSGDVAGLSYLLNLSGLAHLEQKHVKKAGLGALERRLVQVSIVTCDNTDVLSECVIVVISVLPVCASVVVISVPYQCVVAAVVAAVEGSSLQRTH
jgi:hypothetical protein